MFAQKVLMIRPVNFGFNEETALSNSFQNKLAQTNLNELACAEFDSMIYLLQQNKIDVLVFDDAVSSIKPDAFFLSRILTPSSSSSSSVRLFSFIS